MDKILNGYFFNPTKGDLKIEKVVEEIINYISEKPEKFYDVIVGCDSSSGTEPHFPLAVVVLRVGEGGRFFLKKIDYKGRIFYNWKQRILEEVYLSCQFALYLRENFEKVIERLGKANLNYQFRYIHADVGENGKTKDMIKEVTGLIKGNGFEPKIKPESFAASSVADRYS
ncbi:MAG TPA: ribonuclease H-like YkuK family protein [Candidatus Paceibacterota bacterium]|nr:ribonuclease H-like YkuK family protein [Candidatus Paceibacterota bacterium]